MNLQNKYDSVLGDLLSLMQEGLLRLMSQKPMDVNKFKHYFNTFYGQIYSLELQFHDQRNKMTKYISKLRNYCMGQETDGSLQSTNRENSKKNNDQSIQPPIIRYRSNHKNTQYSQKLNSIQQQQEEHNQKRRSETAGGFRTKINKVDHQNGRPLTGQIKNKRYTSKTISNNYPHNIHTTITQNNTIDQTPAVNYTIEAEKIAGKRKSFYDELQKQKDGHGQVFNGKQYKLTYRKKNRSQQKWIHKISRLL